MSDLMLYGVLEMPYEMAMSGEISRRQFWGRAQEAAKRLKAAEARLAELDRAPVSTPQQSAQRASVDTDDFRELLANWGEKAWGNSADEDMADECFDALIAHINAWGSAGSGAVSVPIEAYLWLMGMGRDGFVEDRRGEFWWRSAFNERAGLDMMVIYEAHKRDAAPSPAPQGEQA